MGGSRANRRNLELRVNELVLLEMSVSVPQHKHGLFVICGVGEDKKRELGVSF